MLRPMPIALALTLGCFVATASAEQWGDVLQQDKSQQNSADEAQLRAILRLVRNAPLNPAHDSCPWPHCADVISQRTSSSVCTNFDFRQHNDKFKLLCP
jgi:hypothetical protein